MIAKRVASRLAKTTSLSNALSALDASMFVPTDISGLSLWMDGADTSTMTITGSNQITQWVDKSTNAVVFSRSAANAPVMTANAFGTLSAPSFSGGKTLIADNSALQNLDAVTVLVAVRTNRDHVTQAGGSTSAFGEVFQVGNWATQSVDFGGNFPGHTVTNGIRNISAVSLGQAVGCTNQNFGFLAEGHNNKFVACYDTGSTGTNVYRGATEVNTGLLGGGVTDPDTADISPNAVGVSVDDLCIGGVRNGASPVGRVDGYIAEILVYNKVLTAVERARAVKYLERKWGFESVQRAYHVIVEWQSNAITADVLKANAPVEFTSPTFGSYVNVLGGFIHDLDTNINLPSLTEYGPEQRIARNLFSRTNIPVVVSKHAVGGTDVAFWTGPSGSGYSTLSTRISGILDDLAGFGFRFSSADTLFVPIGGESDGLDLTKSNNFAANVNTKLDYWRDTFGLGNAMTVVMPQMYKDATSVTYRDTIRAQTITAMQNDAKGFVVNTDAMTTSDNLHWDDGSIDKIALAVVESFLSGSNTIAS